MTKLIISGGRDFNDIDFAVEALLRFHSYRPVTEVITGEAIGADSIGKAWAEEMGIKHTGFPVLDTDWKTLGSKAGHIRNAQMLDYGPDAVLAFPGGAGTQNMVDISMEVPWVEVIHCKKVLFNSRMNNEYQFCSNFSEGYDFHDEDGLWWATSEHYYQAHKTVDPKEQFAIQDAATPADAKELGSMVKFKKKNWERIKVEVMRQALALKFAPETKAAELLKATGWVYLVEYAPWGDTFWGQDADGLGHNWQGRLLNERRFQL